VGVVVGVGDAVGETVGVVDGDAPMESDADGVIVDVGVPVPDADDEADEVGEFVVVVFAVFDGVNDGDAPLDREAEGVAVPVGTEVAVPEVDAVVDGRTRPTTRTALLESAMSKLPPPSTPTPRGADTEASTAAPPSPLYSGLPSPAAVSIRVPPA